MRGFALAAWCRAADALGLPPQLAPLVWSFVDVPGPLLADPDDPRAWWSLRRHALALRGGRLHGACHALRASLRAAAGGAAIKQFHFPASAASRRLEPRPLPIAAAPAALPAARAVTAAVAAASQPALPRTASGRSGRRTPPPAAAAAAASKPRRRKFPPRPVLAVPAPATRRGRRGLPRLAADDLGAASEFQWQGLLRGGGRQGGEAWQWRGKLQLEGRVLRIGWVASSSARAHKRRAPLAFLAREEQRRTEEVAAGAPGGCHSPAPEESMTSQGLTKDMRRRLYSRDAKARSIERAWERRNKAQVQ